MVEFLINIIVFILSLALLVVVHEFGHFITAKAFNVYVTEFSIGFGPAIYTRKDEGKETRFSIRGIPLGGYCAMVGEAMPELSPEEYTSLNDKDKELVDLYQSIDPSRRLDGIKKWKRAIVMVAGVALNFLLGFILLLVFYGTTAFPTMYNNVITVSENSIAEKASWTSSDVIYSSSYVITINDVENTKTYDCSDITHNLYQSIVDLSKYQPISDADVASYTLITKENKEIKFDLKPVLDSNNNLSWPTIGITFTENTSTHLHRMGFKETFANAGETFVEYSVAIVDGIIHLFTPEGINNVGGVISIFQVQKTMMDMGVGYVINLWAMISINLGIFNLLPFPGLDGWHLLVVAIEGVTRKELPKKFKEIMSTIGMIILFGLMILITFKDIFTLF